MSLSLQVVCFIDSAIWVVAAFNIRFVLDRLLLCLIVALFFVVLVDII